MHKNAIKRTHAPNGLIQSLWNFAIDADILLLGYYSNFGTSFRFFSLSMCVFFSFCRCISVHIAQILYTHRVNCIQRPCDVFGAWVQNEWMNRGYIIFAVENNCRQNWLPSFLLCFSSWKYQGEENGRRRDSNARNGWLKQCKKKCMVANKELPIRGRKTAKRDNEDRKGKRNWKNNNAISKKKLHWKFLELHEMMTFFFRFSLEFGLCSWIHSVFSFCCHHLLCSCLKYTFQCIERLHSFKTWLLNSCNRKGCCLNSSWCMRKWWTVLTRKWATNERKTNKTET